jgi:C-terminal processing protease CtpA/Prc
LGEKALYFLHKNGTMRSVDFKGKDEQNHAFSAPFSTDLLQEQRCVFEDIWRYQKEYFYDGAFHGADWDQLRSVYAQWVSAIRHERDFNDLMNMLVGELNASHQRYAGKRKAETVYGHLGIQVTTQENRWTITDILPKSPFARAFPTVPVGAQLVAVEGLRSGNLFQALRDRVGERISVTVNDGTKEHTAILRPVSQRELADQLAYPAWVEANRKRVHDQTDHRLGYLHIEGMDIPSLEVFEMELFSEAADKEALVIDVRYNGGGWTTDFLLNMLFTPDHAYTIPRDGHEGYPQGRRTFFHWHQPVYVLCNEFSYSNAEIFSHAIKTLKRGTLIGTPTFGAVISTGGKSLINGAWIRMPFRGWYVKGSGINQENNGAVPHEIVPYTPDDQLKGTDPQLDKAIELFLKNPSK